MRKRKRARIISALLSAVMLVGLAAGLTPTQSVQAAEGQTSFDGYQAVSINDAGTNDLSSDNFKGTPADDGKVWVDKSVSNGTVYGVTAGDKNFNVVLSALAQSYSTPSVQFTTYKREVAYDVVLTLDMSGSMEVQDITNMVNAVNQTIDTLMKQNKNNRVSVVLFPAVVNGRTYTTYEYLELDRYVAGNNGQYIVKTGGNRDKTIQTATGLKREKDGTSVSKGEVDIANQTPTQLGFAQAAEVLTNALDKEYPGNDQAPVGTIPRIPAIIMMSDGGPNVYCDDRNSYTNPLSGDVTNAGSANGTNQAAFAAIATANYVKRDIREQYIKVYGDLYEKAIKDYSADKISQIFCIGYGISSSNALANFGLNPDKDADNTTANTLKGWLNGTSTRNRPNIGYTNQYADDYEYCDRYLGGENVTGDQLTEWFNAMLSEMVVQEEEYVVANPLEEVNADMFDNPHDITFEDYLGYKMETKGEKQYVRYKGINYTFTKVTDKEGYQEYRWNGTDITGQNVSGPIAIATNSEGNQRTYSLYDVTLTVQKVEETVNGQTGYWKLTWTVPSPLLPIYDRTAGFTAADPIRLLCEVGLEDGTNPITDALALDVNGNLVTDENGEAAKYAFYSNLYDFEKDLEKASVHFEPAKGNPYYYKTGYTIDSTKADTNDVTTDGKQKRYVEVNFIGEKEQDILVTDTLKSLKLTDLSAGQDNNVLRFNFSYNGIPYLGSLSETNVGANDYDKYYSATVTIPVSWDYAAEGKTVQGNVKVDAVIGREENDYYLVSLSANGSQWIKGDEEIRLSGNDNPSVTINDIEISGPSGKRTGQYLTTTYTELMEQDTGNGKRYYIVDALNNQIEVDVKLVGAGSDNEYCEITLDNELQKSDIYYKRVAELSYPDGGKIFKKGHTVSVSETTLKVSIGQDGTTPQGSLVVPGDENSPYTLTNVTRVEGSEYSGVNEYWTGTLTFNNSTMTVVLRVVNVGERKAVSVVDVTMDLDQANYSDAGITWSDFPEVEGNEYSVDISVALTEDLSGAVNTDNLTHTSDDYFHGSMNVDTGVFNGTLGNNGELSIAADDLTSFTVTKAWSEDTDVSAITVRLIQVGMVDSGNGTMEEVEGYRRTFGQDVTLSADGNWTYTWEALPQHVVNAAGEIQKDDQGREIQAYYTVEEDYVQGWSHTSPQPDTESVVLTNERTAIQSLQLRKDFQDESYEELEDKPGWVVEAVLYTGTDPENPDEFVPYTSDTSVSDPNYLWAQLVQNDAADSAELVVHYSNAENIAGLSENDVIWRHSISLNKDSEDKITAPEPVTFEIDKAGWHMGNPGQSDYADGYEVTFSFGTNDAQTRLKISQIEAAYYNSEEKHALNVNNGDAGTVFTSDSSDPGTLGEASETNVKWNRYRMTYKRGGVVAGLTLSNKWTQTWSGEVVSLSQSNYYQFRETAIIIDGQRYEAENGFITVTVDGTDYRYKVMNSEISRDPISDPELGTVGALAFTVVNVDDKVDKSVEKIWHTTDSTDALEAVVHLERGVGDNEEDYTEVEGSKVTLDSEHEWKHTWSDLDRYNEDGEEYTYTVVEDTVEGYQSSQITDPDNEDNTILTNSEVGSLPITKIWQDAGDPSHRPDSVAVNITRHHMAEDENGEKQQVSEYFQRVEVKGGTEDTWTETIDNVDFFDESGNPYWFTITEETLGSGAAQYYTEVPTYEAPDKNRISEYSEELPENAGDVLEVTNTRVGNTSIPFEKQWIDGNQTDRPAITVELQSENADGTWTTVGEPVILDDTSGDGTEPTGYSYLWESVPEFDSKGDKISYRIVETNIAEADPENPFYESLPDGGKIATENDGTYVITNQRADLNDVIDISVNKIWAGNESGSVEEVEFTLTNGSGATLDTVTIGQNNWDETAVFENPDNEDGFPKYDAATGVPITYQVTETEEEELFELFHQASTTTDNGDLTFTFTNGILTEKTVTKVWEDNNDEMGKRPNEISVQLLADGSEYGDPQTLTGDTWSHTWSGLSKYKVTNEATGATAEIEYTAKETKAIPGYTASYGVNGDRLTITNTYAADAALSISKTVAGELGDTDKVFTFTVTLKSAADGEALTGEYAYAGSKEGSISSRGTVTLKHGETITISRLPADVYYEVVETPADGYTASSENTSGTIASGQTAAAAFTNTYAVTETSLDGAANLNVTKNFTGRAGNEWLDTDAFTFTLAGNPDHEATMNAINAEMIVLPENASGITINAKDTDKKAAFGDIIFKQPGEYQFVVAENNDGKPGITYDTTPRIVTVSVVDNQDGTLTATRTDSVDLTFNNTYSTQTVRLGTGVLQAQKVYKTHNIERDDTFEFVLTAVNGEPLPEGAVGDSKSMTVKGGETIDFGDIEFTEVGEYRYTIYEKTPESVARIPGVSYSDALYEVTITVTDDTQGKLVIDPENGVVMEYMEDDNGTDVPEENRVVEDRIAVITNEYDAENASVGPLGTKIYTDGTGKNPLTGNMFRFKVQPLEGQDGVGPVPENVQKEADGSFTVGHGADGSIAFGRATFTQDMVGDVYEYEISEVIPADKKGITYDEHVYKAIITVEQDGTHVVPKIAYQVKDNAEATEWQTYSEERIVFNNSYNAAGTLPISVTKVFTGREGDAWLDDDSFTFTLSVEDEATQKAIDAGEITLPETKEIKLTSDKQTDAFDAITFTKEGTYKFVVSEVVPTETNGITYAEPQTITIKAVDESKDGNLTVTSDAVNDSMTFTNTYETEPVDSTTDGDLTVTKELIGRDWMEGDSFEFTLTPDEATQAAIDAGDVEVPQTSLVITKDSVEHKATFEAITFKKAGTYVFTVQETEGDIQGITYSKDKDIITYNVYDDDKGNLVIGTKTRQITGDLVFTNTYTPSDTMVALAGKKEMVGRTLKDTDKFSFTITPMTEGAPMWTPTVENNGEEIAFAAIPFKPVFDNETKTYHNSDTYVYKITENDTTIPGVTKDKGTVTVTVTVNYDAATGQASSSVQYDKDGVVTTDAFTFTNTYQATPTDPVDLSAKKTVVPSEGNEYVMQGGEFQFKVTPSAGNDAENDPIKETTVENGAEGDVVLFDKAVYTVPGTYEYTVQEVSGTQTGISYDASIYKVTVVVSNNDGNAAQLKSTVTITKDGETVDAIAFENGYNPTEATAVLGGTKLLEGRAIEDGQFTFRIAGAEGTPMPDEDETEVTNVGNAFNFGTITYSVPGTYVYTITEAKGEAEGYTYDESAYEVTVTVTDVDGQLNAVVENRDAVVFHNSYKPTAVTLTGDTALRGHKTLEGRQLQEGEFTFQLLNTAGEVVSEAVNDGNGSFVFGDLTFEAVGNYQYTIVEKNNGLGGVTYDEAVYAVLVNVIDAGGHLEAEVTYTSGEEKVDVPEFGNTYEAEETSIELGASKILTGRDMKKGEFKFVVKDKEGTVISEASNDAEGTVSFDKITFDKIGEYIYTISEVKGDDKTIKYDETVYEVTVTVTDNEKGNLEAVISGTEDGVIFKNTYTAPPKPEDPKPEGSTGSKVPVTGDNAGLGMVIAVLVLALAGIIGAAVVLIRRKRR